MKKVLFICHGNICRSPMAEMVMRQMVKEAGAEIEVASAATSTEEIGNGIYPPVRRLLTEKGVPFGEHHARQMTRADYDRYDYLIYMDDLNRRNLFKIIKSDPENKCRSLLSFCGGGEVADPWYTGEFETAYRQIEKGCRALLEFLTK